MNELAILRATLNASLDGILVVDHETRKVSDFNIRFVELWSIPDELLISKEDDKLLSFVIHQLKNPDGFIQLVLDLYAHPERKSLDILEFKDGRVFERHSEALVVESRILGRVWFFRDITDKVEQDKALRQQQVQLMQSSKLSSIGMLAGGIAHEINNPLAIIKTCTQSLRLLKKQPIKNQEQEEEVLSAIDTTIDRIAKTVMGLRNLSRPSQNEENTPTNFEEILSDVMGLASEKFKSEGVELRTKITQEVLETRFIVNRIQISEVLINLLNNSLDALVDQDEKSVQLSVEIIGEEALIKIIDNGPGVQPEIRSRIFAPFFTTKELGKGTGIGLAVSKSIMERIGGKIFLDHEASDTTFVLRLPFIKA